MRKSRSNGTTTYSYIYNGGKLIQMTRGTDTLEFYYDAVGAPVIVKYNGEVYNYVTTLQGDVLLILDTDGEIAVEYAYDAWGGHVTVGGSMASTLGTLNPLTYRGYVYDRETGLYYLQSRYYNPETGRFLNADAFTTTGQGFTGNNMFAYCGNNPVNKRDPSGHIAVEICISADGLSNILGLDWMGGCGSGGVAFAIGAVSSGSRVNLTAEKKAVRRFVNEVGTSIRSGAEAFWDAYAHSLELQARMQEQRDMAIMAFFEDAFSSPGRAGDFVWMNINNTLTCIELVAFIAAPTVCKGIALALDIGGSIWSTTRFFGKIPD